MGKKHVELSPSKAERWWNCPGSIAACRGLKDTPSENAQEGTAAHSLLERCLKNQDICVFDLVGTTVEGFEVTDEMAEAVAMAIDFVRAETQIGGTLFVEKFVETTKDVSGTLDIAIVRPLEKIIVADFKYGQGVCVEAENNPQLMCYLSGIMKEFPGCDECELVVIQPRAREGEAIKRWSLTPDMVEDWNTELKHAVARVKEQDALTLSGSWCRWCLAKSTCPTLRGELSNALEPVGNKELIFPKAEALDIATITKILNVKEQLSSWIESVFAYAVSLAEQGTEFKGYMLETRMGRRDWIDDAKVLKEFAFLGEAMFNTKLKSPAQLEKLLDKKDKAKVSSLVETPNLGFTLKQIKESKQSKKRG